MGEIVLRRTERKQLHEFLPDLISEYEGEDHLEERTRSLQESLNQIDNDESGPVSLDDGSFEDIVISLNDIDAVRAAWLKAKIARRAELDPVKKGFTSPIPLMEMVTPSEEEDEADE